MRKQNNKIPLPFHKSHAFIIGINDYQNISRLQTAVNDANILAEKLSSEHNYIVHGPLLNPTKKDLIHYLEETMRKVVGSEDRVLFYFAGHGIALDSEEGPNGYLVPVDAESGKADSLIAMESVHDILTSLPCRHGLLILDCCFSGAFKWSSGFRDIVFDLPGIVYEQRFYQYLKDPAWQVITSSASDQKAVDVLENHSLGLRENGDSGLKHSPFALALLEGISGAADVVPKDKGDGVITTTELYTYLRDCVEDATMTQSKRQTPALFSLKKHDKGQYIFLHPRHRFNLPSAPDQNPFMGLKSYNEADASLFYGRDRVVGALNKLIQQQNFIVVSGASGTGKSSVIKAGLLPELRKEGWEILPVIRPGKVPMDNLQESIPILEEVLLSNNKTVLIIDQYEELITQCLDANQKEAFEQQLADWLTQSPNLRIIISVRSDFEPQFEENALSPWWNKGRYVVPTFSTEELREVIIKPTIQEVLFFEPDSLVEDLVDAVNQAPGALPLLSFTLSELYHSYLNGGRTNRALTLEDYEKLGGVIGALRTRADKVYNDLDDAHQNSMRQLMLRMVSIEGGELARKRVLTEDLQFVNPEETTRVKTVANQLVEARLVQQGTDAQGHIFIEPAHDALVRAWRRLWEWVKTIGEDKLSWQNKLTVAVRDYEGLHHENPKKAKQLLWNNNPRLDLLKAELDAKHHGFNIRESAFVQKSLTLRTKKQRQFIGSLIGVMVFLIGASVFSFIQFQSAQTNLEIANKQTIFAQKSDSTAQVEKMNAQRQAHIAQLEKIKADSAAIYANLQASIAAKKTTEAKIQANIATDKTIEAEKQTSIAEMEKDKTQKALIASERIARSNNNALKALQIDKTDPTLALRMAEANYLLYPESRSAAGIFAELNNNRTKTKVLKTISKGHSDSMQAVAFSPDGKTILTGSWDKTAKLWDLNGKELQNFQVKDFVSAVAFSPDGKTILTGSWDKTAKLWDLNGNELQCFQGHTSEVYAVAFSPDGQTILTSSSDKTAKLWNLQGNELQNFQGHTRDVISVGYSPDGKTILTGSWDKTAKLWDMQGNVLITFHGHSDSVQGVTYAPDGQTILTGSEDKTAKLWDLQGNEIQQFQGHISAVTSVAYSPDGKTILTGSIDMTAKLWGIDGDELKSLEGHTSQVNAVVYSPDGKMILTGSSDMVAKLWNIQNYELQSFKGHSDSVDGVAYSSDGKTILTGSSDKTAKLWDLQGNILINFQGHTSAVTSVAYSPDGKTILTGSEDKTAKLWDLQGNILINLQEFIEWVHTVAFSSDGKTIVIGLGNQTVKLWNLQDNILISLQESIEWGHAVAYSPDGKSILTESKNKTAKLYDMQGNELKNFQGHTRAVTSVAYSPDGKSILTGSKDKAAKLWDLLGNELQNFQGHKLSVTSVAYSPDGQSIITGSSDDTANIWDLPWAFLAKKVEHYSKGKLKANGLEFTEEDWAKKKEW